MDAAIAEGEGLSRAGKADEAIAYFERLAVRFSDEPRVAFALGGAFDYAGREAEAVAPYRRAKELGLGGQDLPRWYVQLGSSLRNIGQTEAAIALLSEGKERFPDDAAIRVFRALALHSGGRSAEALAETIELLLSRPDADGLRLYQRALRFYAGELRGASGR